MIKFLRRPLIVIGLILSVTLPALADTIRLKDGSVIRGQIISFKNEQFTILVGTGARGRKSRITVYMEDVESIEFDGATGANTSVPEDTNTNSSQPTYQPTPTNTQPTNTQPTNTQPVYQPTPSTGNTTNSRTTNQAPMQINVRVYADARSNGWTNSGFVVRRGQRIHITATGTVSLGKDATGRDISSGPDGLRNRPDKDKLMRNDPTGGLIAVIGDDNDDFIFIGRDHDFVAQRDGTIFLGVNEGNLSDNSKFFDVVILPDVSPSRAP